MLGAEDRRFSGLVFSTQHALNNSNPATVPAPPVLAIFTNHGYLCKGNINIQNTLLLLLLLLHRCLRRRGGGPAEGWGVCLCVYVLKGRNHSCVIF